jgi:hypothetical protein
LSIFTSAGAAPVLSSPAPALAETGIISNIAIIADKARLASTKRFLFIVLLPF